MVEGQFKPKDFYFRAWILTPMWECSSELKKKVSQFHIKLKNDKEEKCPIRLTMTFLTSSFLTKDS